MPAILVLGGWRTVTLRVLQLPSVCRGGKTSGVTFVISPLRALMSDQVERLRSHDIDVMMLASMDSQDGNTMHELRSASKKPSLVMREAACALRSRYDRCAGRWTKGCALLRQEESDARA
jgi:hypothetical protein